jgi:hypothetical protein
MVPFSIQYRNGQDPNRSARLSNLEGTKKPSIPKLPTRRDIVDFTKRHLCPTFLVPWKPIYFILPELGGT